MKAFIFIFSLLLLCSCGERSVEQKELPSALETEAVETAVEEAIPFVDRPFDPEDIAALADKPPMQVLAPAPGAEDFKAYDGIHTLTYMQMEYTERVLDFEARVEIANGNIRVIQEKPHLTGGPLIIEGYLFKHKSGQIIIVEREEQREAEEVGGCTGAVVINWEKNRIEAC